MFVFVSLLLCMGSFINGGLTSGFDANTTITRSCNGEERQALLGFKANLVGINNTLNDWGRKQKKDCCQWVGVSCDNTGHVTELDLSGFSNGVSGSYSCSRQGGVYFSCGPNEEALFIDNALVTWKGTPREFGRSLFLLRSIDISSNKLYGKLPSEITNLRELVSLNCSNNKLHGEVPRDMGQLNSLDFLDLSRNEFSGNIPLSLSNLTRLSYLNLSYNNLSGRIPTGTQLQSFENTSYIGNSQLCGLPLSQRCSPPPTPGTVVGRDDVEEDGDEFRRSYYMGMGVGFSVGWGICCALFLNRRCRYLFLSSLNNMKDWIYVTAVVHFWNLQTKFRR